MNIFKKSISFITINLLFLFVGYTQSKLSGTVVDAWKKTIPGATVIIKDTNKGVSTDINGHFLFKGKLKGKYVLKVSFVGFKTKELFFKIEEGEELVLSIQLEESSVELDEVLVTGKSIVKKVKEKAYNVGVVDAKQLHHTSLDLGHALDRVAGVRIRESGGVGSRMNFSLNGFRGNQVRFFIDGLPMDNFGSSLQINNIPISLAERIEIYKGVVPIGLGADALGGAVNIITQQHKKSHLEASYSFGSFNTHRSHVNAVYVAKSGFTAQLNAFQNYSDNNYKVNVDVSDLNTGEYFPNQRVKRFNDTYHNEVAIFNVGFVNTEFADQLLFGMTLGQSYREIQTGARMVSVFGAWHTKGNIIMPSVKYKKNDFIFKNLDFKLTANINLGEEKNIDTLHRRYNWFGDFKEYDGPGGERSYSLYKYKNNAGITTTSLNYKLNDKHKITFSNTLNTFDRVGHNELNPDNEIYEHPKKVMKNVMGLGYDFKSSNWNTSAFIKKYYQRNKFAEAYNPSGNYGDVAYRNQVNKFNHTGYGLAATYFVNDDIQLKASYEKSYRLPEANELYGDVINLEGNLSLKPESSNNYNLGVSLWKHTSSNHSFNFNANGFYRDAKDFIRPTLNKNQSRQVMDNLASVTNLGVEAEARYNFNNQVSLGANITYQNLRNNTKYEDNQTEVSVVYKDRVPNEPYLFGNADVSYTFSNLWNKEDKLNVVYNLLFVHDFYLYWPSLGSNKLEIPQQISHDISFTYSLNKKLQFTLECRNLLNAELYDNFSLQKPSRNFTGKIKYTFF
ncbi:TonB-dependent receptor [Tenacibaculum sp. Mcav3-52]|uniref:TonB-dependent receptor n=1 Tax=Tenacibaculum TaxID=104267 RepID=UPI001EF3569C|nr:TonB-dependent receptor [Tenacibaculum mesophilum]MCG7502617.1 TonB-dependent receptor [Tenacibaculum sp. Mcav3-52]